MGRSQEIIGANVKLYIPEIGDVIHLTSDWTFQLYNEHRNGTLMMKMKDPRHTVGEWSDKYGSLPCTIPSGAQLKIDRVYIRKGNKGYSSVTFLWKNESLPARVEHYSNGDAYKIPKQPVRFWAKLGDVNNIEFQQV